MKKIGVLTFQWAGNQNFGASLQSYACRKLLSKILQNENVQIIDFNPTDLSLKGKMLSFFTSKNFREYNTKFLKLTEKIKNIEELKKLNSEFDIFIVGSDQVWRPIWFGEKILHYFFDFVENNKIRIAYAASFGVDFWEGNTEVTEKIKSLIKKFNYISVREESGVEICREIFQIDNVECVLDPTLMINKEDYEIILDDYRSKKHLRKKYIAHMLLDDTEELKNGSKEISKYLDSEIKYIKGKTFNLFGKSITLYNKVSQWLTYLKDAELIITDSFHCTVFSIIFHKKFIVIANPNRGVARLETLLKKFRLKDRFFTDVNDVLKSGVLDKDINYEEVEEKLNIEKEKSFNFLKMALNERIK